MSFKEENITQSDSGIITLQNWDSLTEDEITTIVLQKYNYARMHPVRQGRELIWEQAYKYYSGNYVLNDAKGKRPKEQALKTQTLFILIENLVARLSRMLIYSGKIVEVEQGSAETPTKYVKFLESWIQEILNKKENRIKNKLNVLLKQYLVFGNACLKVGWYQKTIKGRKYRVVDPNTKLSYVQEQDITEKYPYFDVVDIRNVYPDPDATTDTEITYVVQLVRQKLSTIIRNYKDKFINIDKLIKFTKENKLSTDSANKLKKIKNAGKTFESVNISYNEDKNDPTIDMLFYYEEDRVIVVANKVVLYNGENPYWNKKIPFIFFGDYSLFNTYYAMGEVENGGDLQEAEDLLTQMTLDYMKAVSRLKLLVPSGSKIDEPSLKSMDNSVVRADLPAEIQPLNIPAINISPAIETIRVVTKKLEDLTSMTEYIRGLTPVHQETAAGTYEFSEAGNIKFLSKIDLLEPMLVELCEWLKDLQHQYMDDTEEHKIKDSLGTEQWEQITPEIFGYKYKYKFIGSANAQNKNILFNKAMTLLNMFSGRPDINQDYLLEYTLTLADYPNLNIEKLIKSQQINGVDRILHNQAINLTGQQTQTTENQPQIPPEEQARLQMSEANNPLNILNGGLHLPDTGITGGE